MESNVIVTVGLCVKNAETTVRKAVNSIINQDYPLGSMEIIIVDGYSRDKTVPIIKESLIQTNIREKIFYENLGLGKARQIVVENALGYYIVWVDGDMVLPRNFIRRQVGFMDANPKVGIGKGKYGLNKKDNLVATLESMEFLINFQDEGETDSKALGTSGCIYRLQAIRQAGGFDENMNGVGEDQDTEYRVRERGWKLCVTNAVFYEKRRETWRSLWNEYFWHGSGGRDLFRKNWQMLNLYKMLPPVAIVAELFRVPSAYRITRRKVVLLLPFHYVFKRIAWLLGFLKSRRQ